MIAAERNQRLSETFDAMEAGEATIDNWWDAVFPTLEWCAYELEQLGLHGNYDALYGIVESANVDSDFPVIPDEALVYRTLTPETDVLGHDERATVITALRYRNHYMTADNQ